MIILGNLLLAIASFLYLVPLQILLREPIEPSGQGSGGGYGFMLIVVPLWLTIFLAWCILLTRGEFEWLGGGRGRQFLVVFLSWLALTVVTSLAAMLRGESRIPWALQSLMPWGIYLLPLFALHATFFMLNPSIGSQLPAAATRLTLGICGALALVSSLGMVVQWIVVAERKASAAVKNEAEFEDKNIQRSIAEVEALDPVKDFGRLLDFAAAKSLEAPRALATRKIGTHPDLQLELARRLTGQWSLEALGYLELNAPPDSAALAEPVRVALGNLAPWIRRELDSSTDFWPESYAEQTRMALAVADKFAPYGVDGVPAMRELRAAFNDPKAQRAKLQAPQLLDAWLAKQRTPAK